MQYSKQEEQEAREAIERYMKEGMTIYTVLRSVSRSGMSRDMSVVFITEAGTVLHPSWSVAHILGYPMSKDGAHNALKVSGCGMDMGYHVASQLAQAFGLKEWRHEWI